MRRFLFNLKMIVKILNWILSKTNFALINIQKIEFVCDQCENNDVDCSVVGGVDGVIVVYVGLCQECKNTGD